MYSRPASLTVLSTAKARAAYRGAWDYRALGDDATGVPQPSETTTYPQWVQAVQYGGGVATNDPRSGAPAARYPFSIFGPQVNAGVWPNPDLLSSDGQYGYYDAPYPVIQDAVRLGAATQEEADAANPDWYQKILNLIHEGEGLLLAAALVYFGLPLVMKGVSSAKGRR